MPSGSGTVAGAPVARLELVLPAEETVSLFYDRAVAISADGTVVVITVDRQNPSALGEESNEDLRLFRRDLRDLEAVPIPGSEGGHTPVLAPDGSAVVFARQGQLLKLPIDGGIPILICELTGELFGLDWSVADTIVFATSQGSIWRVNARGGEPEEIVHLDEGQRARAPQQLGDGNAILYSVRPEGAVWDESRVMIAHLDEQRTEVLFTGGVDARGLPSGHIVYAQGERLWVRTFDWNRLVAGDEATPTGDLIARDLYRNYGFGNGEAHFAVSHTGTLTHVRRAVDPFGEHILSWRDGITATMLAAGPGIDEPRISPDGASVVAEVETEDGFQVHICDARRCDWTVLDDNGADPVWSADGRWVYYSVNWGIPDRTAGLYRRRADFGDEPELLLAAVEHLPTPESVAADGSVALTTLGDDDAAKQIWLLPPGSSEPRLLLEEPAMVVQLHPSGGWFAHVTPPQEGLYVRELSETGEAGRRITVDTFGYEPLWSADGATLYYRRGAQLMAAPFRDGALGEPREVLDSFRPAGITNDRSNYDVAADGRVLVPGVAGGNSAAAASVVVVLNWFEELKRLVPTDGS